jgi:hypothetical protein
LYSRYDLFSITEWTVDAAKTYNNLYESNVYMVQSADAGGTQQVYKGATSQYLEDTIENLTVTSQQEIVSRVATAIRDWCVDNSDNGCPDYDNTVPIALVPKSVDFRVISVGAFTNGDMLNESLQTVVGGQATSSDLQWFTIKPNSEYTSVIGGKPDEFCIFASDGPESPESGTDLFSYITGNIDAVPDTPFMAYKIVDLTTLSEELSAGTVSDALGTDIISGSSTESTLIAGHKYLIYLIQGTQSGG